MTDPSTARVLLVSALQVHPTLSGGHLRTFALVNALMRRGIDVFVYSFVGRKADYLNRKGSAVQTWPSGVQEYVDRGSLGLLAGYGSYWLGVPPIWLTTRLHWARKSRFPLALPRILREKLAWCDAVIADFPFVYPILETKDARDRLRVLNLHNVEHQLFDSRGGLRDRFLRATVRRIEHAAAQSADVVVSCSDEDRQYFEANTEMRRSLLVPNGIELERFRAPPSLRALTRAKLGVKDHVRIFLFTASKWGPNKEAFDFLFEFATTHERQLVDRDIHLLVVGNVVDSPVHLPALTATGKVDVVEPYFAAADAAVNPLVSGGGTNVKMGEFMAARLPILVSSFGARGYRVEHGKTGFVFEREDLLAALIECRRLFDSEPAALRAVAERALAENARAIDMNECIAPLSQVLLEHRTHVTGAAGRTQETATAS